MNHPSISIPDQLTELQNGPESDDYGRLRPTEYAVSATLALLRDIKHIPAGCVSAYSRGGVRIEWVREAASVHLIVPSVADPLRLPYIYHEIDDDYATEDATPERLAYWLERIADPPEVAQNKA